MKVIHCNGRNWLAQIDYIGYICCSSYRYGVFLNPKALLKMWRLGRHLYRTDNTALLGHPTWNDYLG